MGVCFCCCCNHQSTKCIEVSQLLLNLLSIIFLVVTFFLITWSHVSVVSLVFYALMLAFSVFNIIIFIAIQYFRKLVTIHTTNNKCTLVTIYIGMAFTIVEFILSVFVESLIPDELFKYDHPCWDFNYQTKAQTFNYKEDVTNLCIKVNDKMYYRQKSQDREWLMSIICSSVIEITSIICVILWYNNSRRIKYFISGYGITPRGGILYGSGGEYLAEYFSNGVYKGLKGEIYNREGYEKKNWVDDNNDEIEGKKKKKGKKEKGKKKSSKDENTDRNKGINDMADIYGLRKSQEKFKESEENDEISGIKSNEKMKNIKVINRRKKPQKITDTQDLEIEDI